MPRPILIPLPVLTFGNADRILTDASYAENAAFTEYLFDSIDFPDNGSSVK